MNNRLEFEYQEAIITHYISVWKSEPKMYLWDKGPIEKLPFDFRVLEFSPANTRNMWTYATCCMSQKDDARPVELHLFSSVQDSSIVELLSALAYYHRNSAMVDLNHTVNLGKGWQNESLCSCGFISLPFLDGPELETLNIPASSKEVKFYWLIPVTEAEIKYKSKFGAEALEVQFDKGLNYLDPLRRSLV